MGRFFLNKFSASGALTAIEHFEAAVKEDPDNAAAYAGLAEAYNQLNRFIGVKPPTNVRLLAIRAATRAIQLIRTWRKRTRPLATPRYTSSIGRAETALRRAIELNPRYTPARQTYASYLAAQRGLRKPSMKPVAVSISSLRQSVRGKYSRGCSTSIVNTMPRHENC